MLMATFRVGMFAQLPPIGCVHIKVRTVIVLEVYANKNFNKNILDFLHLDKVKFLIQSFQPFKFKKIKVTFISLNGI